MENVENDASKNQGYVYILSNPSMPGLLKIGMTRFTPSRRVQELSSATGVPTPFQLVYYREFHNCVAAELEIHSILASKGLRHNNQREFFTIDTVDAINVLLSLEDENTNADTTEQIVVENYNEDIDWTKEYAAKLQNRQCFKQSQLHKDCEELYYSKITSNNEIRKDDLVQFQKYVDAGVFEFVPSLSARLCQQLDEQINFILSYTEKGYISGYIEAIRLFLDSIDGITNLDAKQKDWVAKMLDNFARNYKFAAEGDIYIDQSIDIYCGLSLALGLLYDKSFLNVVYLDDDDTFNESWIWGIYASSVLLSKQLVEQLRVAKDDYLGTSCQLQHELLNNDTYRKLHTDEGEMYYLKGYSYGYGLNGFEKDINMAETYWKMAIDNNCKKAYLPYSLLFYSNYDKCMEILTKGILDSCPLCLMEAISRILIGKVFEEDITKAEKKKINRYLDLFTSQMELAFYVDADYCLDAIKAYVSINIALQRKFDKNKIKDILNKIKAVSDIGIESYYSDMPSSIGCFDDVELIEQEAVLTMKGLMGDNVK